MRLKARSPAAQQSQLANWCGPLETVRQARELGRKEAPGLETVSDRLFGVLAWYVAGAAVGAFLVLCAGGVSAATA